MGIYLFRTFMPPRAQTTGRRETFRNINRLPQTKYRERYLETKLSEKHLVPATIFNWTHLARQSARPAISPATPAKPLAGTPVADVRRLANTIKHHADHLLR